MRPPSITRMRSAFSDRRQPMGDDERGAALHQPVERRLHQRLALRVERGGRLVEQQDRRVLQDGAGDGEALALAAGQRDAALAELGVVALRQGADEPVGGGERGRAAHIAPRRVRAAVADVVGDARAEDRRHPAAPGHALRAAPADRPRRPARRRRSIAPALRIVEAQEQLQDRALARARWPDDGHPLARRDVEAQRHRSARCPARVG